MSPQGLSLRPLTAQDTQPVLDLWVEAWAATLPRIDFVARRPWLAARLDALARSGALIIVATVDGRPAGFLTLDPATGAIDQLAVAPCHWGTGVADALLHEARRLSPDGLTLSVNEANPRATRFYARQGFVRTGTGVNPASGLPVIEMRWRRA
jgi:putative acetyltransferase